MLEGIKMLYDSTMILSTDTDDNCVAVDKFDIKPSIDGKICIATQESRITKDELYKDLATILELLLKHQYVCKVRQEEQDILIIEYTHDEAIEGWGCPQLCWLTPEEVDLIEDNREVLADTLLDDYTSDNCDTSCESSCICDDKLML